MARQFHWSAPQLDPTDVPSLLPSLESLSQQQKVAATTLAALAAVNRMLPPAADDPAQMLRVHPFDLSPGAGQKSQTAGRSPINVPHKSGSPGTCFGTSPTANAQFVPPIFDDLDNNQPVAGYSGVDSATLMAADEPHRCDICGKTFAVPARLTRHYRTHTGERPFVCEVCGKSFSVKENLSVHRRIHTKEKPYCCPHCGRGFEHSGKLHRHMRIHTGERPHQCSDCGKTFIQSGQLVIHMRSHTGEKPYVCNVCGKGFTCSKQLKVHFRTHTGERPYACDVCGKTFAYNHVLKLHQIAHLGERLYKCTLCSETFSSKKTFETHIKTHSAAAAAPSNRTSPVPQVSKSSPRPPPAPKNQVRSGQNMTSGGSYVEYPLVSPQADGTSGAKGAPAAADGGAESPGSQSPSSGDNSRNSSSDYEVAGPSKSSCNNTASDLLDRQQRCQRKHRVRLQHQEKSPSSSGSLHRQPDSSPYVDFFADAGNYHHYSSTQNQRQLDQIANPPPMIWPMPALIPVTPPTANVRATTTGCSDSASDARSCPQSVRYTTRTIGEGKTAPVLINNPNSDYLGNFPPRKSLRFRQNEESSPESCSTPPPPQSPSETPLITIDDDKTHNAAAAHPEVVRSTSVIQFAHKPCLDNPPSSQ